MQKITICLFWIFLLTFSALKTAAQLIPFNQKGKWGFASTDGGIRIACIYEEVSIFNNDSLAKVKRNGMYGFINGDGKTIIPFEYQTAHRIYDVIHGEYTIGFNYNPEIHLNKDFDFDEVRSNRYILQKKGKFGILRLDGNILKTVVPFEYAKISFDPAKKIFHCLAGKHIRYFDTEGVELEPAKAAAVKDRVYYSVAEEQPRKAPWLFSKNGKWGVAGPNWSDDRKTDSIVPPLYDEIEPKEFSTNFNSNYDLIAVRMGNNWGMLNGSGKIVLPLQYDSVRYKLCRMRHWLPMQFLFVAKKDGEWGVMGKKEATDSTLVTLLPFNFKAISNVYGYLLVKKSDKWQIYDTQKYNFLNTRSYDTVTSYEHESVNGFYLFQVKNKLGQVVFVGQNGVEFFKD